MAPRKRPCCKCSGSQKKAKKEMTEKKKAPEQILQTTDKPFCFHEFVADLWKAAGYTVSDKSSWQPLQFFSGCTGAATPTWVLGQLLGEHSVTEIGAVENDKAACYFLMKNFRRRQCHIFEEMAKVPRGKKCACMLHGTLCQVPKNTEMLYVCGFACPDYSKQHAERFKKDCVEEGTPRHQVSFDACLEHLRVRRPRFAILENTDGMRLLA